jgi:hypothetical protein
VLKRRKEQYSETKENENFFTQRKERYLNPQDILVK